MREPERGREEQGRRGGCPASRTAGSLGTVSLKDGRGARASKAARTTWATRSSGRLAGEPPSRGERGRDGGESQLLQFRKLMPALQARENCRHSAFKPSRRLNTDHALEMFELSGKTGFN